MIAFRCELPGDEKGDAGLEQLASGLREDGFVRAIFDGRLVNLDMMETGGESPTAAAGILEAGEKPSPPTPLPKGEGTHGLPSPLIALPKGEGTLTNLVRTSIYISILLGLIAAFL